MTLAGPEYCHREEPNPVPTNVATTSPMDLTGV